MEQKRWLFQGIKAGILGIIFSCIGVLILALVAKLTNLSDNFLIIVNQAIKIICLTFATLVTVKDGRYLPKSLVTAVVFWVLSLLLFLLLGGDVKLGQVLLDLLICVVSCVIVAIFKSKK